MERIFLKPAIKVVRLPEPLLISAESEEIDDGFEEGARDIDFVDGGAHPESHSVWDD